MKNWTW